MNLGIMNKAFMNLGIMNKVFMNLGIMLSGHSEM